MTARHTPGPWLTQQHCAIVPLPANTSARIYAHRPGQEDITIGYRVLGRSEEDEANARLLTAGPALWRRSRRLTPMRRNTRRRSFPRFGRRYAKSSRRWRERFNTSGSREGTT
jgi:hypothetical protein